MYFDKANQDLRLTHPHEVCFYNSLKIVCAGESDGEKGDSTCKDTEDDEAEMDSEAGEYGSLSLRERERDVGVESRLE